MWFITHRCLVPPHTPTTATAFQAMLACLWSSTFACMHMAIWGPSIKKGEFPTVPHHLHSPTMAVASQAMLDGPPALAVQHPHMHQKGKMNVTTTMRQQQQQQCDDNDDNDMMTR